MAIGQSVRYVLLLRIMNERWEFFAIVYYFTDHVFSTCSWYSLFHVLWFKCKHETFPVKLRKANQESVVLYLLNI